MRRYAYEIVVSTAPEKLFAAITNISKWPTWDRELESTVHDGSLTKGARFALKPRGGPKVAMTIESVEAPFVFADIAHLPLAKMRTRHEFVKVQEGTSIRVTIEVFGPLGFLWDRLVARKQAAGFAEQTQAFARFAAGVP